MEKGIVVAVVVIAVVVILSSMLQRKGGPERLNKVAHASREQGWAPGSGLQDCSLQVQDTVGGPGILSIIGISIL